MQQIVFVCYFGNDCFILSVIAVAVLENLFEFGWRTLIYYIFGNIVLYFVLEELLQRRRYVFSQNLIHYLHQA